MSIHSKLSEYRPSSRHFQGHVSLTRIMGVVVFCATLAFVLFTPGGAGYLYWFMTAFTAGLLILFQARTGLVNPPRGCSGLGRRIARKAKTRFPFHMYWTRYLFLAVGFTAIWLLLIDQGFPTDMTLNILIALLFAATPIHTMIREKTLQKDTRAWNRLNEVSRFFFVSLICYTIGSLATNFIVPAEKAHARELPIALLAAWIPVVLIILGMFVLTIDRWRKS